jgi:hypothetical protein
VLGLLRQLWGSEQSLEQPKALGDCLPGSHLAARDPERRLDGLRIHDLRHTAVALWIAAGANPKEVAARAGHTSVSFTLDRYGHLDPESDAALRDRLDALYSAGQRDQDAAVVDLFQERSRPQRHPRTRGTPPALGR